jgi:flagellar protein FliO/FliZ
MLTDWGLLARAVLAMVLVLALMAAVAWVARRYLLSGAMAAIGARRRLAVVEHIMLDGKSRLVLVRRDQTEHLLVLGPASAIVVESGIPAAGAPTGDPVATSGTAAGPQSANKLRTLFRAQP